MTTRWPASMLILLMILACEPASRELPPEPMEPRVRKANDAGLADSGASPGASPDAGVAADSPEACAVRACGAQRDACLASDGCYSLNQCLEGCAGDQCAVRCIEAHSSDEAWRATRALYLEWAECFEQRCSGPRPGLQRRNITACAHAMCATELAACTATRACLALDVRMGCCRRSAELGCTSCYYRAPDCATGVANQFLRWSPYEMKEEALRTYEAYAACVAASCGEGGLDSTMPDRCDF